MNIIILPRTIADDYLPNENSAIIRIWESNLQPYAPKGNYVHTLNLTFDDISTPEKGLIHFTTDRAELLLSWFKNIRYDIKTLVVNCYAGISRSPAVALALDDIFHLQGLDEEQFLGNGQYSCFNRYVYHTILKTFHGDIK